MTHDQLLALAENAKEAQEAYKLLGRENPDTEERLWLAYSEAKFAFNSAATPQAIIELVDRVKELEGERDEAVHNYIMCADAKVVYREPQRKSPIK